MTVILVFLTGIIATALWWLGRNGIMSKPWLETGIGPALPPQTSVSRMGLSVFLAVIGALFALFGSAFVMRMDLEAWTSFAMPGVVWANSVNLVIASVFLHRAAGAKVTDRSGQLREAAVAGFATLGFLIGQLIVWQALVKTGGGLTSGPAASFFYLLSGLHGLHILGGLLVLGLILRRGAGGGHAARDGFRLCATYWDFLLIVWIGLLLLFMGWANRLVDICRGILT